MSEPTPGALPGRFTLAGVPSATGYSPFSFYSASSWMFRREVAERVGPWPSPDRVYVSPSQAWLFRAWRAGVPLTFIRKVGVILLWSGTRPGSYANRDSLEHEILARWIKQDAMSLGRISEDAALTAESLRISNMYHSPLKAIARACLQPAYALQMAAGLHPHSLQMALRYGGRGGFIRHHRHLTGVR